MDRLGRGRNPYFWMILLLSMQKSAGRTYANLCELDKSICVLRSGMKKGGEGQHHQQADRGQVEDTEGRILALDYIGQ